MAVIDLLSNTVKEKPDKPAVIANDGQVTFRELDTVASRIASILHKAGVKRGDKVAMVMGNDQAVMFNATYFGIHKLGAVPVPVNTRWAPPEKYYVLEHSDSVAIVAGSRHLEPFISLAQGKSVDIEGRAGKFRLAHFFVTGENASSNFTPMGNVLVSGATDYPALEPAPIAEDPADLLYTSGTTGMPKGVLVPEGNLADQPGQQNLGKMLSAMFGESLLHAVPLFGFTGAHGLMLMSIRGGITQLVLPRFDPEQLLASIARYKATSVMAVPTMLNLAMKHPKLNDFDYSSLKFVFFGAAPIQPDTVRKMMKVWPKIMMLNGYGLTEGGASAACMLGPNPKDILDHPGSVGRPVGCEVIILDDDGNIQPQGEVGEICFRSTVTRRRYYKGDENTRELWKGDALHTGDIGYIGADGYVYLTDRKKDMILRGGYNIFAIEVERVLLEIPEILEAAAIGVPHPDLGEDILAVVVAKPDHTPGEGNLTPDNINAFCREHLADYKCPRHVVFMDELPKNAMSKLIKTELRERFNSYVMDIKAAEATSKSA